MVEIEESQKKGPKIKKKKRGKNRQSFKFICQAVSMGL